MANRFLSNVNINDEYTLPSSDGTENQIIVTDGAGSLSFNDLGTITGAVTGVESDTIYYEVKNSSGSQILKGKGVMAVGTDGNSGHILIDEMVADGTIEARYFLGVLSETINNGDIGRVIAFGELDQFNTLGQNGETWSNGQVLWCDPNSVGDFTITEPDGPNLKIPVAFVMKTSTNGKIQIRVQGHEGIKDLYDTKITTQADGELLVWDNTTGVWMNDGTATIDYTNGRVGIGTTSPAMKLEVEGGDALLQLSTTSSTGNPYMTFSQAGTRRSFIQHRDSGDNLKIASEYGSISLFTGTGGTETERVTILSGGNVGIGTNGPSAKLDVASGDIRLATNATYFRVRDTASAQPRVLGMNSANTFYIGPIDSYAGGAMAYGVSGNVTYHGFYGGGGEKVRITSAGQIGIGLTAPQTALQLYGTADDTTVGGAHRTAIRLTSTYASTFGGGGELQFGLHPSIAGRDALSVIKGSYSAFSSGNYGGDLEFHTRDADGLGLKQRMTVAHDGNVGIGTTSPSSKLQVNGDLTVGDDSTIGSWINVIAAGASQDAGIRFGSESNTDSKAAIYTNTSNSDLHFDVTETTRMLIDSATGNVGIGTSSPSTKLHALGTSISMPALGAAPSAAHFGGSSYGTLFSTLTTGRGVIQQGRVDGTATSYDLLLQPVGGNVGIGTTSSSYTLDVTGTGRFTGDMHLGRYIFHNGDTNTWMGFPTNDTISFRTNNSDRMYINSSGNVGVGTTNPQRKFHVNGIARIEANAQTLDLVGTDHTFIGFYPDGAAAGRKAYIGFPGATSNRLTIANEFNDDISFFTNGSEKVTIENSGDVGIGTTSPTSPLHIQKTLSGGQVMAYFDGTVGPSTYGALGVRVDNIDYGTGMRFYRSGIYDSGAIGFINGTSTVGSININTSSTSYNTTSDYRLKENLTEITDGIDRIKQLKPKRFNFIGDTSIVDGFIAHEAKQVVPEAVTGEKDEVLPNGDPVYQGIDQAKIVPLLTAALQEAITKIEVLENRLQTLENK